MAGADKDLVKLMDKINEWEGWRVVNTRKGYRIWPPPPHKVISCAHGPRNPRRTRNNLYAKLRRAGADI